MENARMYCDITLMIIQIFLRVIMVNEEAALFTLLFVLLMCQFYHFLYYNCSKATIN